VTESPVLAAQLSELLQVEKALLGELMDTISSAHSALLEGGELDTVLDRKQQLLADLEAATEQRLAWFRQHGVAAEGDAMETAIADLDSDGSLGAIYQEFKSAALECRYRNHSLGQVTNRRQHFMNRVAAALGMGPADQLPGYSPRGKTVSGEDTRLLGSA